MQAFVAPLLELAEFEEVLKKRREKKGILQFSGCVTSQKTHMMYALSDGFERKIIAASSEMKEKDIYEDLIQKANLARDKYKEKEKEINELKVKYSKEMKNLLKDIKRNI